MSSDDTTTKLPDDEPKYDTKPGITAVLERINQLGEQLNKKIDDAVNELRTEMREGFRRLDQKLDILNKGLFELQTDHKLLEQRVTDLERKAS
jgi:BMFP domain-containing protein YqiC